MKISILGSCSKGNSTYISTGDTRLLIDVGFSMKKINEKLLENNKTLDDIHAILITHEHSDHVLGLSAIMKKYPNIQIYMHFNTYLAIGNKLNGVDIKQIKFIEEGIFYINDTKIEAVSLSHDASFCFGYTVMYNGIKMGYITDTGYISNLVKFAYKDCNVLAIESNYDYEMLITGNYPQYLKSRIHGKRGHLSNEEAIKFIEYIYNSKLDKVYLMHISQENNSIEKLNSYINKVSHLHSNFEIVGENSTKLYKVKIC